MIKDHYFVGRSELAKSDKSVFTWGYMSDFANSLRPTEFVITIYQLEMVSVLSCAFMLSDFPTFPLNTA